MNSESKNEFINLCGGEKPALEKEFSSKLWKDKNKLLQFFKDCYYNLDNPVHSTEPFYLEMCFYHRERLKFILNYVNPQAKEIILDIGCGIGGLSYNLAVRGAKVYAIDISEESLNFAKELNKNNISLNLSFLFSDGLNICFKEKTFDKVVCADVVEHLNTDEKIRLFKEVNKILKPKGKFFIHTPNAIRANLGVFFRKVKGLFKGNFFTETTAFAGFEGGHSGLIKPKKLYQLISKEGFKTNTFYFGAKIPYIYNHFHTLDNLIGSKIPVFNKYFSFSYLMESKK